MPRRAPLIALSVVALAGIGYLVWSGQADGDDPRPAGPQPPAGAAPSPAPQAPADPSTVALPAPEPSKAPVAGYIAYPDGTYLPPLNGVAAAPPRPPVFHPRMAPFAKVVGKVRDATGREWYLHENGVRSTTYFDAAKGEANYVVQAPATNQPILPEETGK